uniref:Uncharacterized protein n=1 Tax=Anguilla anguilla TaxID=7936 RepID=A0A0E9XUL9_ANGAN
METRRLDTLASHWHTLSALEEGYAKNLHTPLGPPGFEFQIPGTNKQTNKLKNKKAHTLTAAVLR